MGTVAIIGGTGFVGRSLIGVLRSRDKEAKIRLLSRSSPRTAIPGVEWQKADIRESSSLEKALEGCSIVYYLPGILTETREQTYEDVHAKGVIATLKALSGHTISRFILVSAIGASLHAPSAYHRTKEMGEEALIESGCPFTIVRPSLVFGEGDRSISQFLSLGMSLHILPVIGPGTAKVQPVYSGDLAALLAIIPMNPDAQGKVYEVGGPRIYTYREMMESIRRSAHLKALIVSFPTPLMMLAASFQKRLLPRPFLTPDVVRMALADNVTDRNAPVVDFGMSLVSLESWLESKKE